MLIPDLNNSAPDMDTSQATVTDCSFTTPGSGGEMGERQKTPSNVTPFTTDSETPQASGSSYVAGPGQGPQEPTGRARDLSKVEAAVRGIDGFTSTTRPDETNTSAGKGQQLQFLKQVFDEDDFDEDDVVPVRPDDKTLRRITTDELLPPPSDKPVPLDLTVDPDLPEFVSEQRIEFLVMARKRGKKIEEKTHWLHLLLLLLLR